MNIEIHQTGETRIAEVVSDETLIKSTEEGLQLLVDLYYQDFDKIILQEQNISADFFDLKNGIAGEILQKFSNYRVRLAIVGDFSKYQRKSIKDFIYESNKGKQVNFVDSAEEAIARLTQ
ncbi:MAG: DUF4180 domain-containing protein [Candidatus Pedobacter colombiensis]|uniref:DUF4180 domain-containing protein n=1 Tax=Candidatus Pedobacter colombiensis TaxID=3121371 RepID=A0AAJ6BAN2_9SPHI|nr:DUF4180 domain-containing protein [Pedobacter sp.]WEK21423.1 MAG: DUF4180 domain-containing protein [Pedobacter sp.]